MATITRPHAYYCPDCEGKSRLALRFNPQAKRDECYCPRCGRNNGFVRRKSTTQIWRENPDNVDTATANRLADKHHAEIEAVAAGLPPELAEVVRKRYLGELTKEERERCQFAG